MNDYPEVTITELIAKLEKAKEEHGDIPVMGVYDSATYNLDGKSIGVQDATNEDGKNIPKRFIVFWG
jgi:hypothetical protein